MNKKQQLKREYYTLEQAAEKLGCTLEDIIHFIARGELEACAKCFQSDLKTDKNFKVLEDIEDEVQKIFVSSEKGEKFTLNRKQNGLWEIWFNGYFFFMTVSGREFIFVESNREDTELRDFYFPQLPKNNQYKVKYSVRGQSVEKTVLGCEFLHLGLELGFFVDFDVQNNIFIMAEEIEPFIKKYSQPVEPPKRKVPVSQQQENKLIDIIEEAGYDPLAFPPSPSGKAGAKDIVKKIALSEYKGIFTSESVFNKTWQRLRDDNRIKDAVIQEIK